MCGFDEGMPPPMNVDVVNATMTAVDESRFIDDFTR